MTTPCGGQTGLHAVLGSALEGPGQAGFFFRRAPHFCCGLPSRRAAETYRVMPNDSSNDNVVNGLDFDDPPDCNLVGEARHLDQLIAAGPIVRS